MADPLQHVARQPLPWQTDRGLTECGRSVNDVAGLLSLEDMVAKVKREGQARAALTSCMTCWQTVNRHERWELNPAAAVERAYGGSSWTRDFDPVKQHELRALAELVGRHRDEFEAIVAGLADASDLNAAREEKRRRG